MQNRIILLVFAVLQCISALAQNGVHVILQDGHYQEVTNSLFSSDGKYLLTVDAMRNIVLWSVTAGKKVASMQGESNEWDKDAIHKIEQVFCTGGKQLAIFESAGDDLTKIELQLLDGPLPVKGDGSRGGIVSNAGINTLMGSLVFPYQKYYLRLSGNGKYAIITLMDGAPAIYDLATRRIVKKFSELSDRFVCADISADSKKCLLVAADKNVIVCDLNSGNIQASLPCKTQVTAARFTQDGKRVILCGEKSSTYNIIEISSGSIVARLPAFNTDAPAKCIDVTAAGRTGKEYIAIGNSYGNVRVYDGENGKKVSDLTGIERDLMTSCHFSANGKTMVTTSGNRAKIWWVAEALLLEDFTGNVKEPGIGRYNNKGLLEITTDDKTSSFFDINTAQIVHNLPGDEAGEDKQDAETIKKTVSPEKKSAGTNNSGSGNNGKIVITKRKRFDEDKPDDTEEIEKLREKIMGPRKYTDGNITVNKIKDGLEIVNNSTHKTLISLKIDRYIPYFFPNGKYVAIFEESDQPTSKVRLISLVNGKVIKEYNGYKPDGFSDCEFVSPDSKYLVVPGINKTAQSLDDVFTLTAYSVPDGKKVSSVNVSAGGSFKFKPRSDDENSPTVVVSSTWNGDFKTQLWKFGASVTDLGNGKKFSSSQMAYSKEGKYLFAKNGKAIEIRNSAGNLLASLYVLGNADYFITTSDGYYKCSHNAPKYVSFCTKVGQVTDFQQFDLKFNRPDIVLERLGSSNTELIATYRKIYEKRLENSGAKPVTLEPSYPLPEARIVNSDDIERLQKNPKLKIRLKADAENLVSAINVSVNDVPVFGRKGLKMFRAVKSVDTTLYITLGQGENIVCVTAMDKNNAESHGTSMKVYYSPEQVVRPKLFFLGIGADKYTEPGRDLKWCARDVSGLGERLSDLGSGRGNTVIIKTLLDKEVTVENILSVRKMLEKLNEDDKVVVLYSGHGILSHDDQLVLGTYPMDFANPGDKGLPYAQLEDLLDGIKPRRKLMLIDACNSGRSDARGAHVNTARTNGQRGANISGNGDTGIRGQNIFELMQDMFIYIAKGNGATVIAAARGSQGAQENDNIRNGVFTSSVLESLSGYTEGSISVLTDDVVEKVSRKTGGQQVPTVRTENKTVDWKLFELSN